MKIIDPPMEKQMKITIEFDSTTTVRADSESVTIVQIDPETNKKSRVTLSFDEISEISDVIGASVLANSDEDDDSDND